MRYLLIILLLNFLNAELIKPENLDTLSTIHVLFEWEQEFYTSKYNLQISLTDDFNNLLLDTTLNSLVYIDTDNLDWNHTYYWRVGSIYENSNINEWINIHVFHTGNLKSDSSNVLVEIINEDLIQDGYTIYGDGKRDCSIMYDKFGREIWNDGDLKTKLIHIDKFGQLYSKGLYSESIYQNTPLKFNFHHDVLWQGPSYIDDNIWDPHDLKELPNGNFIYAHYNNDLLGPIPIGPWTSLFQSLGYEADGETIEYPWQSSKIYEIDRNDYSIIKEWDQADYFSMDVYDSIGGTWIWASNYGYYDWIHNNTIWYDEMEDALYLSSRQLSRITKIDYSSHEIIWMMGLPNEYIPSNFDNHICTELRFSYQHDVKILDNGNLLFFDNGNLSKIVRDTEYRTSRILEIEVLDNNTCNVVWELDLPEELYASSRGSVWKLDNGNYLINIATDRGDIIEVSPDKEIVWRLTLNDSGEDVISNYRAFRVPSIYPDAYSVVFNSLQEINLGEISYPGIVISEENIFTIEIFNESAYAQDYQYSFSDNMILFDSVDEIISIEANESITLTFQAKNNIDINDFTEINFIVTPINHQYAKKEFNFYASNSINNDLKFNIVKTFPNPFNSIINVIYDIPYESEIELLVYNLNGQLIDKLINQNLFSGRYEIQWDASNYSSGIYFLKLKTENIIDNQQITLIK